ncbi:hypothetical protein, partial [Bradyrhizobium sp. CCBAU 51745]|uniref:hypothetical protein n=1 Tax=Bradyrhizobium sp. CCBAU 51745 TaxID=1325099 RepID=UPI00230563F4
TVSGASAALESLEPSFHQDLNRDGVIGVPTPQQPAPPMTASQSSLGNASNLEHFVFGPAPATTTETATVELSIGSGNVPVTDNLHSLQPTPEVEHSLLDLGGQQAFSVLFEHLKDAAILS